MERRELTTAHPTPCNGMALTFTSTAAPELAGIPATIVSIWPRFRSGDYLVTLKYQRPVRLHNSFVEHIDAFMSELEQASPR